MERNTGSAPNNIAKYKTTEYKISCDIVNCDNIAISKLKISCLKPSWWICPSCKQELEKNYLIGCIMEDYSPYIKGEERNFVIH